MFRLSAYLLAIMFFLTFANHTVVAQLPQNGVFWGLDLAFGTDGVVTFFPPDRRVFYYHDLYMSLLPDGDILSVLGYSYLPSWGTAEAYTFARFTPDGQVIDQVTTNGYLAGTVGSQSDGKFILREVDQLEPDRRMYLTRYESDFTQDLTFGESGEVLVPAETIYTIVQPDDKILGATYEEGYLFRFNKDGSVDKKFSKSIGPFPWVESIGGHPNGNVIVLWSDFDRCVAQIFTSGGDLAGTVFDTLGWDPDNHCNARDFLPTKEGASSGEMGFECTKRSPMELRTCHLVNKARSKSICPMDLISIQLIY
jgi:hypothetical protein